MSASLWEQCLNSLESEFPSQQFNMWIRPLQAEYADGKLVLFAPNRFVLDWIVERFLARINELVKQFSGNKTPSVALEIGSRALRCSKNGESIQGGCFSCLSCPCDE